MIYEPGTKAIRNIAKVNRHLNLGGNSDERAVKGYRISAFWHFALLCRGFLGQLVHIHKIRPADLFFAM